MNLVYTAISTFDASCCDPLTVVFTETRSWDANSGTQTVTANASNLLLQITNGSVIPNLPMTAGTYTVTHTINSVNNPNGCELPVELTVGNTLTYTYVVTAAAIQNCFCTVVFNGTTATFTCQP